MAGVVLTVNHDVHKQRMEDKDDSVEEIQQNPHQNQDPHKEKCDLFVGEWIPNPLGPMYTNESCNVITDDQNCMSNGGPDFGYLYWRWKPRDCELPRFDAARFLDSMRNKHWGFVGDSISRNHVQSVLCILSKVEAANAVYHDEMYRDRRLGTSFLLLSPFEYHLFSSMLIKFGAKNVDTSESDAKHQPP